MTADQRARRTAEHRTVALRPMRELLTDLRKLPCQGNVRSADETPGGVNRRMVDNAQTIMAVCQNGMAALGHLLAHSAPVIEDGTISATSLEAIGWLMAELGDLSAACLLLSAEFRCAGASDHASTVTIQRR